VGALVPVDAIENQAAAVSAVAYATLGALARWPNATSSS
jgi:hypothetical protein